MPPEIITTEHTLPYIWKKKVRFMLVKRIRANYEKFYIIRTKKGEYTLQFADFRWSVISPKPNNFNLGILEVVGRAILDSGL